MEWESVEGEVREKGLEGGRGRVRRRVMAKVVKEPSHLSKMEWKKG